MGAWRHAYVEPFKNLEAPKCSFFRVTDVNKYDTVDNYFKFTFLYDIISWIFCNEKELLS